MSTDEMTEQDKAEARAIFEGKTDGQTACWFCGGLHTRVAGLEPHWQPCPRVKRIERHPDGSVLVVEHWPPGAWETDIIFPADVYEDSDT